MIQEIAWKNIWRSKKRSIVIIAAIALGLWGGMFSNAIYWGMGESMVRSAINRSLGHIQIHHPEYRDNPQLASHLSEGVEYKSRIDAIPHVTGVSQRVIAEGMAASPESSFGVQIVGIDPNEEATVTELEKNLVDGTWFETDKRNPIVIGAKLAERLDLSVKSKIVLSFQAMDSSIAYMACRIVGTYSTSSSLFDETHVFLQRADLWRVLGSKDIYHEVAIRAEKQQNVDSIQTALASMYPDQEVATWGEISPELTLTYDSMQAFMLVFMVIVLLALLFGIVNTMFMAVLERTREIGMLLAIGMKQGKLFLMILLETILLSLTGGIIGVAMTIGSIAIFGNTGIDLSIVSAGLAEYGIDTVLYPFLPVNTYYELFIMVLITAVVASIFPAMKAVHTKPAEAIRDY
ncbi:MAG: hypothetical protein CL946_10150 [Ectothiorhodospiraceae bacterium]|nr:hypothetical protein [Ectothiorhodospiraceae bacterium]